LTKAQLKEFEEILRHRFQKIQAHIQTLLEELDEIEELQELEEIKDLDKIAELSDTEKRTIKELLTQKRAILLALEKIQNGTYGYCKDGSEIAIEKLRENPIYEC